MEQAMVQAGRRSGWSDQETNMLWETADEAQQQGLPLKAVFERISQQTGRRPNSIRNYYYAQVREKMGGQERTARFVPFTEDEVTELMETVIRDKAQGKSVRSCLQRISGGDHSLMLRYQNKYRSVIKSKPELVKEVVDKLKAEGIEIEPPAVNSRSRASLSDACLSMVNGAQRTGDPELVKACETLGKWLTSYAGVSKGAQSIKVDLYRMALDERQQAVDSLIEASMGLLAPIKEFLGQSKTSRTKELDTFCRTLADKIGPLEQCMQEAEPVSAS